MLLYSKSFELPVNMNIVCIFKAKTIKPENTDDRQNDFRFSVNNPDGTSSFAIHRSTLCDWDQVLFSKNNSDRSDQKS